MSERADRLLREAVAELAGTPHQPPDFAATAIVQGRRMRRRRQTIAVAAAAIAVGAIAAPYVWLRPDPQPPALSIGGPPAATTPAAPTGTDSPTPRPTASGGWRNGPVELPGGALLLTAGSFPAANSAGPTWVYDAERRRYVSIPAPYTAVRVSPYRPLAAVRRTDRPTEVGLYDLATGKPQWVPTSGVIHALEWSPDGRRLLITIQDRKTGMYSMGLLAPDGGSAQYHPVKARALSCAEACHFTWLPNGREVALPLTHPVAAVPGREPSAGPGIQLFAADNGAPTRFLPVQGEVVSSTAWSPDESLVVVSAQQPARPSSAGKGGGRWLAQVVSVRTGKPVRQLPSADVTWLAADRLLYLDGKARPGRLAAVLVDPAGVEYERAELPAELFRSDDITVGPLTAGR